MSDRNVLVLDEAHGRDWSLFQADCVDFAKQMPSNSVDLAAYSPPFSNLFLYGPSERDMGNTANDREFLEQYSFLVRELYRVMRPGRVACVHCKDLVNYKGRDGAAGLRDLPGEIIRVHLAAGFTYHSKVTVWRSPVTEMQKTKAHGLLYKQLRADSTFSRQGMPEYVVTFRKWCGEEDPPVPVTHTRESFPLDQWQEWASPVWMHADLADVLNVQIARDDNDERHMAPLSLDIVRRLVGLWSNPGEVVFSPFAGVGSEGVGALEHGRKFLGTELKDTYFRVARGNLARAMPDAPGKNLDLFAPAAATSPAAE